MYSDESLIPRKLIDEEEFLKAQGMAMTSESTNKENPLIPEKYPQRDLFICDVADAVLKDIMPQMEHPFYSLSKKPDTTIRLYEHGDNWLKVIPSVMGLATIYDKDILIYCISQIMAKVNAGEAITKRVRLNSADLLRFTNRGTSGRDYMALNDAIERISGTRIQTNIRTGDEEQLDGFGLIESHSIRRKHGLDGRLLWCDITISDWVFNAIKAKEVLTLHRDYFRLRKPLERRVYELARKHCGQQPKWSISIELLLKKTGSRSPKKQFRYLLKELVSNDHLPDYRVELVEDEDGNKIIFYNRNSMPLDKAKTWDGSISPEAFESLGALGLRSDKYVLEQEFREWIGKKQINPKNADKMFISFCRKKRLSLIHI